MSALITSCEEDFEPLKDNAETPFSIYGYLETPADSNWVRISEVRNTLYTDEDASIDAVVTLEHLESGQKEEMKDSLFRYEGEFFAFNFKSDMTLEPDQAYLLTAARSDGQTSSARVSMPPTFPDPQAEFLDGGFISVDIEEVKNLAAVDILYEVRNDNTGITRNFEFLHLHHASEDEQIPDKYNVYLFQWLQCEEIATYYEERNTGNTNITILRTWAYIASAGPEWIHFPSLDSLTVELPDVGNVENGAGYLLGVVSKEVDIPGASGYCRTYWDYE